ncbi:MAG: hydantoinase/oxoprolinase family protein [Chloroflexi bacterium]|nr:hydantoinase/oxoprolinase family protein [Chloroflexota bacterium]
MPFKVGVDVGGTFTDFLLMDKEGKGRIAKTFTTPRDPSVGVIDGLHVLAAQTGLGVKDLLRETEIIVHGTTITTNAVLTGQGARTGLLTTKGFRDILAMRRGLRERQYDSKCSPPPSLAPRYLRQPVEERVNRDGEVVVPLNEADVQKAVRRFEEEGVEAVAICFLFSFLNPAHERTAREMLERLAPEISVSLSSEILPQVRVYERVSTTVLNAYVAPLLARYLERLQARLEENGFEGMLLIMQSNGGVMSPLVASRFAANTLLSGPAAGPCAGLQYARAHGLSDIISIDMGGTSFDACLVKGGSPQLTANGDRSGYRIALPMMDMHTIGSGGGSIAWIDAGGLLRVGPRSAGAEPGPVCYGRGGQEPTVTDADLLLGYLDPHFFWGGGIKLDVEGAERAIRDRIAKPLGRSTIEAAHGIFQVVNSNMAAAVRVVSVQRGFDPREFGLVVAGGAGPIHAGTIAEELGIPRVIVPGEPSVFCAAGMLLSDLRHDFVRTYVERLDRLDFGKVNELFAQMQAEALDTLAVEGIPPARIALSFAADLRYVGQFNEVETPLDALDGGFTQRDLDSVLQAFNKRHDSLYGYSMPYAPAEMINLRLHACGSTDKPVFGQQSFAGPDASGALKGTRKVFLGGAFTEVPVYDGHLLQYGNEVPGPAIVEQPTTTIIVSQGSGLMCDEFGSYVILPNARYSTGSGSLSAREVENR